MRALSIAITLFSILSLSAASYAAPSKALLEAVLDSHVTLTLTNEEELHGTITRILDESVIFISDVGDVVEIPSNEIERARLMRVAPPVAASVSAEPQQAPVRLQRPVAPAADESPGRPMTLAEAAALNSPRSSSDGRPIHPPAAPAPRLSHAGTPPAAYNPNSAGRALRATGKALLVPGVLFTTIGLGLLIAIHLDESLASSDADFAAGVFTAVGISAMTAGTTLVVLGKKRRRRAIAAAHEEMVFSIRPSFAQGRPGAQLGFTF